MAVAASRPANSTVERVGTGVELPVDVSALAQPQAENQQQVKRDLGRNVGNERPVAAIQFVDADSGDEAHAFVRAEDDLVMLGLSLRGDGDIEVGMQLEDLDRLIAALKSALAIVRSADPNR